MYCSQWLVISSGGCSAAVLWHLWYVWSSWNWRLSTTGDDVRQSTAVPPWRVTRCRPTLLWYLWKLVLFHFLLIIIILIIVVVNTLAESYLSIAVSLGGAAEHAAVRKSAKYSSLPSSHSFQPLALETLGPMNTTGIAFLSELGCRLTSVTGDSRETTYMYLFQRVSLAVQRYNSVAFKGTFLVNTELD